MRGALETPRQEFGVLGGGIQVLWRHFNVNGELNGRGSTLGTMHSGSGFQSGWECLEGLKNENEAP